ncbi:MAG: C1 family peptidase [Legionella sp.]|uniref:C1 family peptidase n=1 Tax=Legionella sp. TaxID=459 RepID=UPI0039E2334A
MKLIPVVASMLVSSSLWAQDINIKGTISHTVMPTIKSTGKTAVPTKAKELKLLKIELSNKAKLALAAKVNDALAHKNQFAMHALLPSAKQQLGMNAVPVLDQGEHGTCVTFASTAAVDAAMNKGDYISQLCQLQVGKYLEENGYGLSGWNGSFGRNVLMQMENLGIISKTKEASAGCGASQYPIKEAIPDEPISLEQYHHNSEPLKGITWSSILDIMQTFVDRNDTGKTLANVKKSLDQGDRVTFGTLLLDLKFGFVGAVGTKNATNDTWVLTPEIARDVYLHNDFAGHEMIITGYDDNAIAIDDEGRKHQGLLTLRNSWSDQVGDHGNFYMSYDYFKLLVIEAQRIHYEEQNDE